MLILNVTCAGWKASRFKTEELKIENYFCERGACLHLWISFSQATKYVSNPYTHGRSHFVVVFMRVILNLNKLFSFELCTVAH